MNKMRFAVLGGGNGGQAMSAYLKLKGYEVNLYERYENVIAPLIERGRIELQGTSLNGTAKLNLITTDLVKAVEGTDVIFVVLPATAHGYVAHQLSGVLKDGQVIVICPGSTGGVLEFRKILKDEGCTADVKIAETTSLFYACRAENGVANISGVKKVMPIASFPSSDAEHIIELLKDVYPQLVKEENVLVSSLSNLNAILHPIAVLLSTGWIEATGGKFRFYYDSITPSIGKLIERMDAERLQIAEGLGVHIKSVMKSLETYYGASGDTIYEMVRTVKAYEPINSPPTLNSRLITEDIPMGLVPLAELAKRVGVETPMMDIIIDLASQLLDRDFRKEGRTLESLGLDNMSVEEIHEFIK